MATISHGNRTGVSSEVTKERVGSRPSETQLKQLMLGGAKGDTRAYTALLRALNSLLTSFYRRRLRDALGDVEDLVQETLIAMHTRRSSYDQDRAFTPWLFAIARHKLVDHYRARRRHQSIDGLDDILRVEGFEDVSNARLDVERLLDQLPPKQSRSIRQTRLIGLSVAEAAREAGIGQSDVKVSVHRGLKALSSRVAVAATC